MSSIAKANISLSKKDLTKSRIPLVSSRNIAFYHKATVGSLSINLLALSMPSEMPTMVQATADEISGARLLINKKNLSLVSSANGPLIQGMDYVVTSSTTIQLIGLYEVSGAEADEIFVGTINSAPVSDIVVASARSVDKTYTLAVGQTTLNLGREYEVGMNPNDDIGSIKVFVNGVLAHRDADYAEVDSGSGYGTTISFFAAPVSIPYQVAVDFGVMSISDNDAIGTMESLSGAVIKIAADLADVAGTNITDYLTANPSEVERRTFGDTVLSLDSKFDTTQNLSVYTKTKWQRRQNAVQYTANQVDIPSLRFSNLTIGKTYRVLIQISVINGDASAQVDVIHNGSIIATVSNKTTGVGNNDRSIGGSSAIFIATATTLTFNYTEFDVSGQLDITDTFAILEELPNHEITTDWT